MEMNISDFQMKDSDVEVEPPTVDMEYEPGTDEKSELEKVQTDPQVANEKGSNAKLNRKKANGTGSLNGKCYWSVKAAKLLILEYNKRKLNFKCNTTSKLKIWISIANVLKKNGFSFATASTCEKKWSSLAGQYKKLAKKPIKTRKNWKYYKEMEKVQKTESPNEIKEMINRLTGPNSEFGATNSAQNAPGTGEPGNKKKKRKSPSIDEVLSGLASTDPQSVQTALEIFSDELKRNNELIAMSIEVNKKWHRLLGQLSNKI